MSSTPPVPNTCPPTKPALTVWVVAEIAAALLVVLAVLFLYPGALPKSTPLNSRIAATKDRPVEIQARLEKNVLDNQAYPDRLDVLVTNYGTAPLTELRLTLVAPGFAEKDGQPKQAALPMEGLTTGHTYLFQVPMLAAAGSGSYSIASQVSWVDKAQQTCDVTIGPVLFDVRFGAARWTRLGSRAASLVKDLALPLLLLILTTMFARRQSDKEALDRTAEANAAEARRVAEVAAAEAKAEADMKAAAARETAEAELEHIRQEEQRKREERLQVTRLLLERVMDLAQTYYMPIVAAAKLAFRDVQRCKDSPASADYAKVTYDLFRIIHLMLNLCVWAKDAGGQGSFYRSQHELVFVFRSGSSRHRNNMQLGKFGRYRTNVWQYPSVRGLKRMREMKVAGGTQAFKNDVYTLQLTARLLRRGGTTRILIPSDAPAQRRGQFHRLSAPWPRLTICWRGS